MTTPDPDAATCSECGSRWLDVDGDVIVCARCRKPAPTAAREWTDRNAATDQIATAAFVRLSG